MEIKKAANRFFELIKHFLSYEPNPHVNCEIPENEIHRKMELLQADMKYMETVFGISTTKKEPQPLISYETRRKEIIENADPIEGIFYIYNGRIIPDHYSESLFSDKDIPRRGHMYHMYFFPHYMLRKFDDLYGGHKSIPRGRISGTAQSPIIYIDGCYKDDEDVIKELIGLYRLPQKFQIVSHKEYSCPACFDNFH